MDLNSILQSGVDPKTGNYLSPEERKEAFRKALGKTPRSGYVSAKKNSALVRQDGDNEDGGGGSLVKRYNFKVIEKLIEVKKIADELLKTKRERVKLESKFAEAQRNASEKTKRKKEESGMESRKSGSGKNILTGFASKAAAKVGGGLFGILKALISYAILDFISKPENRNMVEGFVKLFMGIFKFFSFYVGTMVNSLLGGFTRLFGGGSILERVFGGLQLIFGIFLFKGFTRVLNPLKLIGDIKWAIKNAKNFKNLFTSLFSKNLSGVGDAIKQIFPKTASIFKKGLQGALQRVFLKVFGKNIFTFLKPFVGKITKTLVRPLAKLVTKVPVVGTLLAIPINMFLGDPVDKAAVKAIGSGLGAFVVGALGSIVPGAGTVLGAIAGGLLGDFLAGWLYDSVLAPLGKTLFGGKKDQPQLNTGGIASGPETGYDVTLHGTEVVIPLDKLKDIILTPYKSVASIIMGATIAVLKSMGPVGSIMAPIALQMFNPFIRIFGLSVETFTSGLGKGADLLMSPASAKEFGSAEEYLSEQNKQLSEGAGGGDAAGDAGGDGSAGDVSGITLSASGFKDLMIETMNKGGITDKNERTMFMAQVGHESGEGRYLEEIHDGSNYEGRTDLGNTQPGDGKRFKGRGYIQITGRANYKFYGPKVGVPDATENPQKLADPKIAAKVALAYWMERVNRGAAKKGLDGINTVTRNINGGLNGLDDRIAKFKKYQNDPEIQKAEKGGIVPLMKEGGEVEEQDVTRLFDKRGRDVKNTAPGHSQGGLLEFSSGGIVQAARKAVSEGRRGPASPPCASWVRMVLGMAGHPAANKVTKHSDLDAEKKTWGPNMAASFAGSDMGAVIRNQSSLQPGDIVLHSNTYGSYPPGAITHVSIASDKPGKILHQSTSGGAPKEGGVWNFAAGIRLGGSGTVGSSDQDSGATSAGGAGGGGQTTTPEKPSLDMGMLRDLYTMLTGKTQSPSAPEPPPTPSTPAPPAPTLPTPTPSRSSSLPSMSSQFTLDRKMSVAHGVQSPTVIVNSSTNFSGNSFSTSNLNTMSVSEKSNLNLL